MLLLWYGFKFTFLTCFNVVPLASLKNFDFFLKDSIKVGLTIFQKVSVLGLNP